MRKVGVSRSILVANPALAATLAEVRSPSALLGVPLLEHAEERGRPWRLHRNGATEIVEVEPRFTSGSFELLLANVRAGLGVAFFPSPIADPIWRPVG